MPRFDRECMARRIQIGHWGISDATRSPARSDEKHPVHRCNLSFAVSITALLIMVSVARTSSLATADDAWSGKLGDASQRRFAPATGFIADAEGWQMIWKAWRPDQAMPSVDFATSLVLVGTVPGPNEVLLNRRRSSSGNIKLVVGGTRVAGPGFGYKLIRINRDGATAVNRHPIDRRPTRTPILFATAQRSSTELQIVHRRLATIIDIRSPVGIDAAILQRVAADWPDKMLVRLHLAGLESLQAIANDVTLQWSVASTGGHDVIVSLRSDGKELPIGPRSPYHAPVRIAGGSGSIPRRGGYFEIELPSKLFETNPIKIDLRWVDFYRN